VICVAEKPTYNSPVGPIPIWPAELNGKIHFACVPGDMTCTPGASAVTGLLSHITYTTGSYIPESVKFIQQQWSKQKS
jgi:cutinase